MKNILRSGNNIEEILARKPLNFVVFVYDRLKFLHVRSVITPEASTESGVVDLSSFVNDKGIF